MAEAKLVQLNFENNSYITCPVASYSIFVFSMLSLGSKIKKNNAEVYKHNELTLTCSIYHTQAEWYLPYVHT